MSQPAVMDSAELELKADQERARNLASELRELQQKNFQAETIMKSKDKLNEKRTYKNDRLTHKDCKPNSMIKPEVRDLIRQNVIGKNMKTVDATKTSNVSRHQVQRIKAEDPNHVKTHKKRTSKFTNNMKTELLLQLEQSLEQAQLAQPAFGYSPSGQPAVLSLVPNAKQVTLIGALSEEGFVYHKLRNTDNTKAKGVGANDFCLFLGSLGDRLPNESIIIMDNTPIYQGDCFEEIRRLLDSLKSIQVKFLPPYSPFLNSIEYSFHLIKSYVQSKEPPNRAALVSEIKLGIDEAITPKKSKNLFSHCHCLYRPCIEMQEITGPVLAAPPE
ncbi:hypothetical protein PTTG_27438 [Puccinia triticina 1-1 BBBD Race 1]|uniref:DDE_3 domain-containing protein n=1 Tax=Puccinia triticina (isolate 1-1 / race 1 (BBBD)) TaxID=630390 RepID=A0A180GJM7_PUCT1|nr:hypothetical protein PTTG_27438 [Puccinia triticina 1-1 BBBD Race 1]